MCHTNHNTIVDRDNGRDSLSLFAKNRTRFIILILFLTSNMTRLDSRLTRNNLPCHPRTSVCMIGYTYVSSSYGIVHVLFSHFPTYLILLDYAGFPHSHFPILFWIVNFSATQWCHSIQYTEGAKRFHPIAT